VSSELESRVRDEVEALHEFFVGWFTGKLPLGALEKEFLPRFDADFHLIPPTGDLLTLGELQAALHRNHAANPDLQIAIRNVTVHKVLNDIVVATYEEWQRHEPASANLNSARISTVVLDQARSLKWLHVHEAWLPEAVAAAGFDATEDQSQ